MVSAGREDPFEWSLQKTTSSQLLVSVSCACSYLTPPPPRHGALDLDPLKQRRQAQRVTKKDTVPVAATKPKEVKNFSDEEESTTKDVAYIYDHVKKTCEKKGRLHYFKFLIDPDSFAQSVENMFHFSFLIKDGRAGVMIGKDKQLYIYIRECMPFVLVLATLLIAPAGLVSS